MKGRKRMETSCHFLLLMVVFCCPSFVHAQGATSQSENPASTTKNTSELLATLDHLVEQNRQLEKQNQELVNQINSLRQFLAKQSGAATDAIPKETGIANPAVARFGMAYSTSREDRFNSVTSTAPDNTTIRLGDSLLLFATGSLAPQVTVQKASYHLLSSDAGLKYKGLWLQGESYYRLVDNFVADGILCPRLLHVAPQEI